MGSIHLLLLSPVFPIVNCHCGHVPFIRSDSKSIQKIRLSLNAESVISLAERKVLRRLLFLPVDQTIETIDPVRWEFPQESHAHKRKTSWNGETWKLVSRKRFHSSNLSDHRETEAQTITVGFTP